MASHLWEVVAGVGAAAGGLGAMVGAGAAAVSAYYSSRSSGDAARAAAEAREALILLGRSKLDVTGARRVDAADGGTGGLTLGVTELMGEIAVDVDIELELANGEHLRKREHRWPANFLSEVLLPVSLPPEQIVPRRGRLTYGDTRGMARFELSFAFDTHGNAVDITERRLWPPPLPT